MTWTDPTTRSTGDLITASDWNTDLVNNIQHLRLGYSYHTSNVTTSGTTFATGQDILQSGDPNVVVVGTSYMGLQFTADGTSDYIVRVSAPNWSNSNSTASNDLWLNLDGATAGRFAYMQMASSPSLMATGLLIAPTAGTRTVNVRVVVSGGTATIAAGAGGSTNDTPILVEVRGA